MSEPWFQDGLRFSCQSGCTRCCGGAPGDVFVTDAEIAAIAAELKVPVNEFEAQSVRHYFSLKKKSIKERPNGDCVLLDTEKKGCSVYASRPEQCRHYPFWPEVVRSTGSWLRESKRCPGINMGDLHDAPKIIELVRTQKESGG